MNDFRFNDLASTLNSGCVGPTRQSHADDAVALIGKLNCIERDCRDADDAVRLLAR